MDFHSLSRRDLQALCKRNKIPANITNVAMADSLKALEMVEGMEDFMQSTQSESAQSSIESPSRSEVTSPYVAPTTGRSTRRRNVAKEEPVTANPATRTRRTARKTLAKDADEVQAIKTPAMAVHTNSKKGQMTSVCRKMDSQLKECADEGKKDVLVTPAVRGLTSRRRTVKEDSTVNRVYSTRRSVRLAVKNVEILNEVLNEETEDLKKELLTEEGENKEMNLKEGQNDFNETSEITGIDAVTTMEENSEKDNSEVVSALKQDSTIGEEIKLGDTAEEEEAKVNIVAEAEVDEEKCEIKLGDTAEEEEANINIVAEAEVDEEKCEDMVVPLSLTNEVNQCEGSYDVCISDIEFTVEGSEEMITENDTESEEMKAADNAENVVLESKDNMVESREEMNTEKDPESEEKAADCIENVAFETKDNFAVDEFSGETGFSDEIEKEFCNDEDDKISEDVPDFDVTLVKFTELGLQQATKEEAGKTEILQLEEPKKAEADDGEAAEIALASVKKTPNKQQPSSLTPSKYYARKKASEELTKMTVFSDNKENIGSHSKLVVLNDRVKMATEKLVVLNDRVDIVTKTVGNDVDNLHEMSMRKLTKMLKDKLEITKKSNKNENGNEQALSRPALQVLPENR